MSAIDIVFRNEHFAAVDKPAGWLSVPSRLGARDPRPVAGRVLEESLAARTWPVHRLDEEASGLLLFALSARAHAAANGWFERRLVGKSYRALTEAGSTAPPPEGVEQVWEARLLRGKRRAYESPAGKPCRTRATFTGRGTWGERTVLAWLLRPETGRPHQLRWEMASHGWPILGDELYGAREPFLPGAIALRCVRLDLSQVPEAASFGLPPLLEVGWDTISMTPLGA